jgi:hypothetical protein
MISSVSSSASASSARCSMSCRRSDDRATVSPPSRLRWLPRRAIRRAQLDGIAHRILDREAPVAHPLRLRQPVLDTRSHRGCDRPRECCGRQLDSPRRRCRRASAPTELLRPSAVLRVAEVRLDGDLKITGSIPGRGVVGREEDLGQAQDLGVEVARTVEVGPVAVQIQERLDGRNLSPATAHDRHVSGAQSRLRPHKNALCSSAELPDAKTADGIEVLAVTSDEIGRAHV